jgi:hypothetical protein
MLVDITSVKEHIFCGSFSGHDDRVVRLLFCFSGNETGSLARV